MIFVNKKILLILTVIFVNMFGQNTLHQQFEYANQLYNQEKYFDAITELKRLQLF